MSPVFAARRRAEEFNSLVEGSSTRELHDARTVELAQLVGALRETAPVQARPAFVADLRERLMAEAATAPAPAAPSAADLERRLTVAPRRTARDRRIAAAVGGFAIVGATTSMAMAAQSALPGETLYPLKRTIEDAQAGLSVDRGQKGQALLANASGRLDEVQELSRSTAAREAETAGTIALTLAAFTEQAGEASELLIDDYEENGDAEAIAELRDFTGTSMDALAELEAVVPDGARAALIQAAQLLTQVDAEAAALCSVCGGKGISVIPPFAIQAVEDVLGGLAGALIQPIDLPVGPHGGALDTSEDPGKGTASDAQGSKQPPTSATLTPPPTHGSAPVLGGGGSGGGDSSHSSTLGGAVDGLLGGGGTGGSGSSGSGGTSTSAPTTVPEVIDDVLGGADELAGTITSPSAGTQE